MTTARRSREERYFIRPLISDLTKPMLIATLNAGPQHFQPPRMRQQSKQTLLRAVYAALNSERYADQMREALRIGRNAT